MRLLTRIARIAGLAVVGLIASGASVEFGLRVHATLRYPHTGQLVDVGDRQLHMDCRGQGTPTVVFEAGLDHLGATSWSAVHDSIAATTRACAYSRAGILWSDASRGPFDVRVATQALRRALAAAGEMPPFVIVGHSIGGPYAMVFTATYPDDVAGLVLVDPSHPRQVARLTAAIGRPAGIPMLVVNAIDATTWTGLARLAPLLVGTTTMPREATTVPQAFLPRSLGAVAAEARAIDATFAQAERVTSLGDRPLIVLTAALPADSAQFAAADLSPAQGARRQVAWRALHDDLARRSRVGRRVGVDGATHYIQFDRPDAVIGAVRDVVAQVRVRTSQASTLAGPLPRPRLWSPVISRMHPVIQTHTVAF